MEQRLLKKTLVLLPAVALLAAACSGPLDGGGKAVRGVGQLMDHHGAMHGMMGGGQDTSGAPPTQGGAQATVDIRDFRFEPGNLEVAVGAQVTWTNFDSAPHTASANDGSWDTGILNEGGSGTVTFAKPGEYLYYCKVHPDMKARILVR